MSTRNVNRLATLHVWGHNVRLPRVMASLASFACGQQNMEKAVVASTALVLVSLLILAVNLILNGKLDRLR